MPCKSRKKFKTDLEYRIYRIRRFGNKFGWKFISESNNVIEFLSVHNWGYITNSTVTMKINYITFEIQTSLNHPKKGNTHLIRKGDFTMDLVEKIFRNPRTHMPETITSKYLNS